ncbi:MGMT family protein [Salinimonas lutimaris]|uniref:MGMT family protein n=1 Tax=Salinimonas lutimaris TaxID=914153 RepID=UPI0010BFA0EB|nr:MGMT family protein [Salinimonas lutimaris]
MPNSNRYTQIYAVVTLIPTGQVASYGQIADLAGLPGRARLAGKALKDSTGHDLPWHRVVRADGTLAFPAGSEKAREQREKLLSEGVTVNNMRADIKRYGWQPDLYTMLHKISS